MIKNLLMSTKIVDKDLLQFKGRIIKFEYLQTRMPKLNEVILLDTLTLHSKSF